MTRDEITTVLHNEGANAVIEHNGNLTFFRPSILPGQIAYKNAWLDNGHYVIVVDHWELYSNDGFINLQLTYPNGLTIL